MSAQSKHEAAMPGLYEWDNEAAYALAYISYSYGWRTRPFPSEFGLRGSRASTIRGRADSLIQRISTNKRAKW